MACHAVQELAQLAGEHPDPPHAGVDLQMRVDPAAKGPCGARQPGCVLEPEDGWRQIVLNQQVVAAVVGSSENEDRRSNPSVPQLDALLDQRHSEKSRLGPLEGAS